MNKMREQFEEALKTNPDARFWNTTDAMFWAWQAALSQPAAVEGWVMVPVEPTKEMWAAVNKLDDEMAAGGYDGKGCSIEQAWDCLLAAASAPPSAPVQQRVPIGWQDVIADIRSADYTFGEYSKECVNIVLDSVIEGLDKLSALSTSTLLDKNDQADGEAVAWINQRGDYVEISRPDTVYGSHTIPLYKHPQPPQPDSNELVEAAVNRFLGWKLPTDFAPDCGISFKRSGDYEHPEHGRNIFEPIGTNLFTAEQARAMFKYCLDAALAQSPSVGLNTKKGG